MSRPKSRQVGTAGLVMRRRDGTCTHTCRRCGQWKTSPGWRAALRAARAHDGDHHAADARYVGTPWGIPAHELPPARRRRPLRRLATAMVVLALVLALVVLAFVFSIPALLGPWTGHATPAPAAPSIAVAPTTTPPVARPGPAGYVPTPAGPPATDANGTWIPEPGPPAAPPTSSSAGGGR